MFISKSQKEKIELVNHALGMDHRTKPFDLLKASDLIEAATYITAEYLDLYHYQLSISNVNSDFDESLETFYPAKWASLSFEGTTNDDDVDETINYLNKAETGMRILEEKAEEKCAWIWQVILTSNNSEVKMHFFGKDIQVDKETVKVVLEDLFYLCDEVDYNGNVEDSASEFAKALLRRIDDNGSY